jgi:hypothetical protein
MLLTQVGSDLYAGSFGEENVASAFIQAGVKVLYKHGATVINGQSIQRHLYGKGEETDMGLKMTATLSDVRPPSRATWIEWSHSKGIHLAGLCQWMALSERAQSLCVIGDELPVLREVPAEDADMFSWMLEHGAAYLLGMSYIASQKGAARYLPLLMNIALDEGGVIIHASNGGLGWMQHPPGVELTDLMDEVAAEISEITLFALSALNAKNVKLRPQRGQGKKVARRRKAGKQPLLSYLELEVEVQGPEGRMKTVPLQWAGGGLREDHQSGKGLIWVPAVAGVEKRRFWTGASD